MIRLALVGGKRDLERNLVEPDCITGKGRRTNGILQPTRGAIHKDLDCSSTNLVLNS